MENNRSICQTLLFHTEAGYSWFHGFNVIFAFIAACFPLILSLFSFDAIQIALFAGCFFIIYVPYLLEKYVHIVLLEEIRFLTTLHIFLHGFVGKTLDFYDKYFFYDDILHIFGGVWLAFLAFFFVFGIELRFSPPYKKLIGFKTCFYTLSVVNLIGVLWEVCEFAADHIMKDRPGYRLAQESLSDTMWDLIQNNIGAIAALCFLWYMLKHFQRRDIVRLFQKAIYTKSP